MGRIKIINKWHITDRPRLLKTPDGKEVWYFGDYIPTIEADSELISPYSGFNNTKQVFSNIPAYFSRFLPYLQKKVKTEEDVINYIFGFVIRLHELMPLQTTQVICLSKLQFTYSKISIKNIVQ